MWAEKYDQMIRMIKFFQASTKTHPLQVWPPSTYTLGQTTTCLTQNVWFWSMPLSLSALKAVSSKQALKPIPYKYGLLLRTH